MKDYRLDFPLLKRRYNDRALVYFDNAATAPKPQVVIKAVNDYYNLHNNHGNMILGFYTCFGFLFKKINKDCFNHIILARAVLFFSFVLD